MQHSSSGAPHPNILEPQAADEDLSSSIFPADRRSACQGGRTILLEPA